VNGISDVYQDKWEKEIKKGEEMRLQDPSVMDILGAKDLPKEDTTVVPRENNSAHGKIEEWIQLGINIEEKQ